MLEKFRKVFDVAVQAIVEYDWEIEDGSDESEYRFTLKMHSAVQNGTSVEGNYT